MTVMKRSMKRGLGNSCYTFLFHCESIGFALAMEICFAVRHAHGYKKIVAGFLQNKLLQNVHCHSGPASNIYLVAACQISVGFAGVEL